MRVHVWMNMWLMGIENPHIFLRPGHIRTNKLRVRIYSALDIVVLCSVELLKVCVVCEGTFQSP